MTTKAPPGPRLPTPRVAIVGAGMSGIGNQSLFGVAETQIEFAMNRIHEWTRGQFESMSPTVDATESFNNDVKKAMPETIWVSGGCESWYLGPDGTPTIWPWSIARHKQLLAGIDPDDWIIDATTSDDRSTSTAPTTVEG